jgi:hypothetical protein
MTEIADAPEKIQIDWIRAIAGAMAAVASAVLLSTLGAAGTILGAAIGSFVVTVVSAWFAQGLSTSRRKLARKQKDAAAKVGIAQAEMLRAARTDDTEAQDSHLDHADARLAEAREELDEAIVATTTPASWRERLARLPWKHIGLTTLALFLVALVVITALELVAGKSVSAITGGSDSGTTTIGHIGGSDSGHHDQRDPSDQPTESADPSDQPTQSADPSESVEPTAEPTETASPSDTQEPSPADPTAPAGSPTQTHAQTTSP